MSRNTVVFTPAQLAVHPLLKFNIPRQQIGPPSEPLKLSTFAADARNALDRAEAALVEITAQLEESPFGKEAQERCSVADLKKDIDDLYDKPEVKLALDQWHVDRVELTTLESNPLTLGQPVVGNIPPGPSRSANGDPPGGEGADSSQVPIGGTRLVEGVIAKLLDEAHNSPLEMVRDAPQAYSAFIRKARRHEVNTLTKQLQAPAPAESTASTRVDQQDPLSNIILTVTFHSIPRKPVKRTPAFALPTQTLNLRGTTTLAELKRALKLACDWIPSEVNPGAADQTGAGRGSDSDSDGSAGGDPSDGEEDQDEDGEQTRWTKERSMTGCAFAVENRLYADEGQGKVDYGQLFIQQLNSKEYTNKSRKRVRARSPSPDSADSADDHDGQPAAPITDRPIYTTGPHIRETKIGALRGIRTGEPYWFIHQGNCEHIWEVNAVRYVHPNDPPLADPGSASSTAPYPITTLLSRAPQAQCRLCDRDPGEIVTLDDDLAGEAVALLCRTCFNLLHGGWGEDGGEGAVARDGTRAVPTLIEE